MSARLHLLDLILRVTEKPRLKRERDPMKLRAGFERAADVSFRATPGSTESLERLAGADGPIPALWVAAPAAERRRVIMHLHGGAYFMGSAATHRRFAAALSARTGARVVLPEYRLAPEHRFPAAPLDALAAYRALLDAGYDADAVALSGDSAGGGLALALLHMIGEEGLPHPAATLLLSPWVDLTLSGESLRRNARRDAMIPSERVREARDEYLHGHSPDDPRATPLNGRYAGAGPVMIQASRAEVLEDDATRIAAHLTDSGVDTVLEMWDGCPHVWQMFHGRLPEADRALDSAGAFLDRHIAAT